MTKPDISSKKRTNEKPVSLHPLEFKQALQGLLATSPHSKKKSKKDKQELKKN